MQFWLVVALTMDLARSEIINIDHAIDWNFDATNNYTLRSGMAVCKTPGGVYQHVSYSEGELVGLDSLRRTGKCTAEFSKGNITYNLYYGLGMWVQTLKLLKIGNEEMSAAFRIWDNSCRLTFTIQNASKCTVFLDEIRVERLANVEFMSSHPDYDGKNVEHSFRIVAQAVNEVLDYNKKRLAENLQSFCKYLPHEHMKHLPGIMTQSLMSYSITI